MFSWSTKRKLFYLALLAGTLLLLASIPTYFLLNKPESCFDGKQNQNEVGVDCGGTACRALCSSEVAPLITYWSRHFQGARAGFYDAVAFIENPNVNAGVKEVSYSFKLYNQDGLQIAERLGKAYINPNERFAIFEGGIETKEQRPVRADFMFTESLRWEKVSGVRPQFFVEKRSIESDSPRPAIKATISNKSLDEYRDVTVVGLLYDGRDNAFAVSKTEIKSLPGNASRDVTLILPTALSNTPVRIEIIPRFNGVERN